MTQQDGLLGLYNGNNPNRSHKKCQNHANPLDGPVVHRRPQRAPRQGRVEAAPGGAGGLLLDGLPGLIPGPLGVPPGVLAVFPAVCRRLGDSE